MEFEEHIKKFKVKKREHQVYDSKYLKDFIEKGFKRNIKAGFNKYPALSLILSQIPGKFFFIDNSTSAKKAIQCLKSGKTAPKEVE